MANLSGCEPEAWERHPSGGYGFVGVYHIRELRAWYYEVPKSGSTTMGAIFGVQVTSSSSSKALT